MQDPRLKKLAYNLLHYSVGLKEKEVLNIEVRGNGHDLARELIKEAYAIGAYPYVEIMDTRIQRELMMNASAERAEYLRKWSEERVRDQHATIIINGVDNDSEMSDVPNDKRQEHYRVLKPLSDYMIANTRWVLLNYPTPSMAQNANMSTEAFEDFFFDVCITDYRKMHDAFLPLQQLMNKTDKVRLVGPGTDLTFSIKGIPNVICAGENNIPDGEIFTAPVRDSVNGVLTHNATTQYMGTKFENITLRFENGKIVEASSNNTKKLNEILDTDEGARYIGEFAIGVNPYVLHPMNDILFDEKIAGSFHFTPGQAYEDADNGNRSIVHWDMVTIQRPEYGGGEIWFDDVLIRKDGLFVLDTLQGLNPDALKS
ncbi:thermophilic metalloprotease family protein [Brevibacillus laterosporus GI-9]|uniref:aminopeptidase n=1 Tax=Brevibacillus TaxID=55080 RepID=UPI0002403B6F|nr:aminopeptidase [Brevibacillus laterosporus]MCR8963138.1 aminopeptidase [Brevibacillus laterosporus]MCZ0835294.1 aminopeptidase [Brevibacillus halotolerans]CCF14470.1 thermophilic metalloprotease family protein [Brevibacillus laterosporus GI-9]